MEPKIIEQKQLTLARMSFCGDPVHTSEFWTEENEIGRVCRPGRDHRDEMTATFIAACFTQG
jgi:hypothetical protein